MKLIMKSKNPLRDYRKAVVTVMTRYFAVDARSLRFRGNVLRAYRAEGASPAYAAIALGCACRLPVVKARVK